MSHQIYTILKQQLGSLFTEENWTSKMQSLATESRFTGREGDYSDFTYRDTDGSLTRYLTQQGFGEAQGWLGSPPTYHIEVKTTNGRLQRSIRCEQ